MADFVTLAQTLSDAAVAAEAAAPLLQTSVISVVQSVLALPQSVLAWVSVNLLLLH